MIFFMVLSTVATAYAIDYASEQLSIFKSKQQCPVGVMTTVNGAPVELRDTLALNDHDLISNIPLINTIAKLLEEKIPDRVVHAKGAGAFGYFITTHNVTKYCKAKMFSEIGKVTPVATRFSHSTPPKGGADTVVDSRGFACKFYTEGGILDMVGFHTPMFTYKNPYMTQPIFKTLHINPVTGMIDPNMFWDIITLRTETVNCIVYLFGKNGIPNGFRHMPGFSIHTYQIYNKCGEIYFARWVLEPEQGVENLCIDEAMTLSGIDLDYMIKDLYNGIECAKQSGEYPSWTVGWQILTLEDVKNAGFDVFDITKQLPVKKFPITPVGKLVLNRNPTNYFADVEQMAFCPGNVVPGIMGAPDSAFALRSFAYNAAQRYRLGSNFNQILVNCPLSKFNVYDRDGKAPVGDNGGAGPNYYPNSFRGPLPYVDKNRPKFIKVTHIDSEYDDFFQATELYNEYTEKERNILARNIVISISGTCEEIQKRVVKMCYRVDFDLGQRLEAHLRDYVPPYNPASQCPVERK